MNDNFNWAVFDWLGKDFSEDFKVFDSDKDTFINGYNELYNAMFWIEHNLGFQLENYKDKYVKIKCQLESNKYLVEVLYIKSIEAIEKDKVIVHTDQRACFLFIDDYIDHADIFTKSPKSETDSTLEINTRVSNYTIKELTRTEYDDWLFRALNVNVKYEKGEEDI